MRIEITDYITANTYKALLIICNRKGVSFESIVPTLNLCNTDSSLMFYDGDKMILTVDGRKLYDTNMQEIDLKEAKVHTIQKMFDFNLLRKKQKNTVLITFDK